ncbi:MAG TPA: hypothetical protein VHD85_08605, partial [Terracidiphilus sp.]|nr:hypothetical protein [Terracidiphilus sp.]
DKQGYSPGPSGGGFGVNPYAKTLLNGPNNFVADLSVFKVFPITESTRLRFNMDTFNVFNMQGLNNPGSGDGVLQYTPGHSSSHFTPRQVQLTLRFEF